ncbi:MAG TPA: hemerythrin domain-containing protein [Streptosporangiaceae bacterium]
MAEAETIYRAAGERDDLASLVSEMTAEHQDLASAAGRIPGAPSAGAAGQAAKIAVLFTDHVAKENDVLLPALPAARGASLAQLPGKMHRRTQAVPGPRPREPRRQVTPTRLPRLILPRRSCHCCWRQPPNWPAPGRQTGHARAGPAGGRRASRGEQRGRGIAGRSGAGDGSRSRRPPAGPGAAP